jgi:predicted TIM-barrel fold metal-dependent hydrolase
VDPKRKDALDVLKKAVEDMGMRGLKFHPPLQDFYPNDEKFFHLYQAAVDWKIPVVFHVGTTPFGSLSKLSQANPLLIDDVAVTFPELRIVLTHLGTLWHNEAFMVVEKNPCVFIDTAAYLYEIEHLLTADLIARIGENKIIFGTDYPMPSPPLRVHNMIDFVGAIERLATTDQVKEKIFSLNFKKMIDQTPSDLPKGLSLGDIVAQADA